MHEKDSFFTNEPRTDWSAWNWQVFGAATATGAILIIIPLVVAHLFQKVVP
jgi:hypothetical protein